MKVIKSGKYELHYERYIDDMGFERDGFSLFDTKERVHRPFLAPPKAINYTKDKSVGEIGYTYSDEELEEILDDHIKKQLV